MGAGYFGEVLGQTIDRVVVIIGHPVVEGWIGGIRDTAEAHIRNNSGGIVSRKQLRSVDSQSTLVDLTVIFRIVVEFILAEAECNLVESGRIEGSGRADRCGPPRL